MKRTWETLASANVGTPYGHAPGHRFHDVEVAIAGRDARYRVEVKEQAGSAQRHDEVHHSARVVALDDDLDAAIRLASARAQQAGMRVDYLVQALSQAHADAMDAIDDARTDRTDQLG